MSAIEPGQPVGPVTDPGGGQTPTTPEVSTADGGTTPIYGVFIQGAEDYRFVTAVPWVNPGDFELAPELLVPMSLDRETDPREASLSVGVLTFGLIDGDDEEFTQVVSSGIEGKPCTFYSGFLEDDWNNAAVLFTGVIADVVQDERGYRVTARSTSLSLDRIWFSPGKTKIHTAINSGSLSVIVDDASTFALADPGGLVLIDSEYIQYLSLTDNGNGTWTLNDLIRGLLGSTAVEHSVGTGVQEIFVFSGHPLELVEFLDLDHIDQDEIAAQIAAVGPTYEMQFRATEPINIKRFIEDELLRPFAAYPYESGDGMRHIKIFGEPTGSASSIADSDCCHQARWRGNFPKMINHVIYFYDWDPPTRKFLSTFEYRDEALITAYGDFPLIIEAKGIRSELADTADMLDTRARAYVARFGQPVPVVSAVTLFSKRLLETGDDVNASFESLVNLTAGVIGFSDSTEIIGARHDFIKGEMVFELFAHPPSSPA